MKKHLIALSAFTIMAVATNAQTKDSTGAAGQHERTHMHHEKSEYGMHQHHHNIYDEHSILLMLKSNR